MSKRLRDVTYISVRHILEGTSVSLEMKFLALGRVDNLPPMGIRSNSEAIFLELWDGEKVCNSSFIEPHLENPKVPDLRGFSDACITIPT